MSWVAFIFGLVVSALAHLWLLRLPPQRSADAAAAAEVVPVLETELARLDAGAQLPPEPPETGVQPPAQGPPRADPPPQVPDPPPPQPPMIRIAEADHSQSPARGDLAGEQRGRRQPDLRIDWGSEHEARSAIDAGGMVVVVLDVESDPHISHEIVREGETWNRRVFKGLGPTLFSNRLRIVDHVPAFSAVRAALSLTAHERLAVLLPTNVERLLDSVQMKSAFSLGLAMEQVESFAGRFSVRDGALRFDVVHIEQVAGHATP